MAANARSGFPIEEILLREYDITMREMVRRIDLNAKTIGLGFIVLATAFSFGLKERVNEILIVAPLPAFAVLFYSIFNNTLIFLLAGYRRYIAERLNALAGERILVWVPMSSPLIVKNWAIIALNCLNITFLALTVFVSLNTLLNLYGYFAYAVMAAIMVALTTVSIVAALRILRASDEAYQLSRQLAHDIHERREV